MENLNRVVKQSIAYLKKSQHTFQDIYTVMFGFSNHVIAEVSEENKIKRTTYGECETMIEMATTKLAKLLDEYPFSTHIGIKLDNSLAWIITFWSLLRCGYIPVLINTQNDSETIKQTLKELDVKKVISNTEEGNDENYIHINEFIDDKDLNNKDILKPHWADEIILISSGTTGKPKLCIFNGEAICNQIFKSEKVIKENRSIKQRYHGQIKLLAFLPFYHIFGLVTTFLWFGFFGRTFVFLKDQNPHTILRTIKKHEVTHIFAVPLLWNMVAKSIKKEVKLEGEKQVQKLYKGLRLSEKIQNLFPRWGVKFVSNTFFKKVKNKVFGPSVQFCISGGGYVLQDTLYIINGIGYPLYNGYGMTEVGITSVELRKKMKYRMLGTVGKPFENIEYSLSKDNELLIRGDSLCSAFLENGEIVQRNPQEVFSTGDIACKDKNGYYYIKGRMKDIIVLENGENINPDDVERYFDLDNVSKLCIVGTYNQWGYEDVTLVIQPVSNITKYQFEKLKLQIQDINNQIPKHMQVKHIYTTEEQLGPPQSLKVNRMKLRKRIESGRLRYQQFETAKIVLPNSKEKDKEFEIIIEEILTIMKEILQKEKSEVINPEQHFIFDLGGNSLEYFSLVSEIETKFNIKINFNEQLSLNSAYDFANYIKEH